MRNSKLERDANQIIGDLIAKIEELEHENEKLEGENNDLSDTIAAQDEQIEELKNEIKDLENKPLVFDSNLRVVNREEPPNYNIN